MRFHIITGTYKKQNEIETKPKETKWNETKQFKTKRNGQNEWKQNLKNCETKLSTFSVIIQTKRRLTIG